MRIPRATLVALEPRIVELYSSPLSINQTAAEAAKETGLPISRAWVQRVVDTAGVMRSRSDGQRLHRHQEDPSRVDRKALARRMHAEGSSLKEISVAAGASLDILRNWMPEIASKSKELHPRVRARLLVLYAGPLPARAVALALAREFGIKPPTQATVLKWVRRAGIVRSKSAAQTVRRGKRTAKAVVKVLAARAKGVRLRGVAAEVGVSDFTVRRWLRELAVPSEASP